MKEKPLENIRILAGAVWGASVKDIKGDHLNEYHSLLRAEDAYKYNQEESVLKQMLFSQVTESLTKKHFCLEELLTVPWSSRRIKLSRIAASLIAFTNDHGKKTTPEFFPIDEIVNYLQSVRQQYEDTGDPLTIPDQFAIALSQTNNNPVAAALLAHGAYRSVARVWDTRISSRLEFPVTSDVGAITMMNIADSTADFVDDRETVDPLGNTYHFWSQFTAGMVFTLEKRQGFQTSLYNMAFSYGPELTSLIREKWGHKSLQFGNHKKVDMQGLRLGRATGNLIVNKLRIEGERTNSLNVENLQRKFTEQSPRRNIKDLLLSKFIISPENIADSVYPIVEAIHEIKPDYMLVLDRGGRIVGMATYMLYQKLYGSLPTHDHSMHFQRISRRLPSEIIHECLERVATDSMNVNDSPTVFVIDDWMNTGRTKTKIDQVLGELSDNQITTYYGVLRGRGKNVIGDRLSVTFCTWHNNSNLIGVEYSKETGKSQSVHSHDAILFRRRLSQNIEEFAKKICDEGDLADSL